MKAVLNGDIIVRIGSDAPTEIGPLPKGAGLERLRFDGARVVDLAELTEIWVRRIGPGHYELHAIEVPGSQLVAMDYAARKHLVTDPDGTTRLRTMAEILARETDERQQMAKNRLRATLAREVGDHQDMLADMYKLVFLLIDAVAGNNGTASRQALASVNTITAGTYPAGNITDQIPGRLARLRAEMRAYNAEKRATNNK